MIDFHHGQWRGQRDPSLPLPHWFEQYGDLDRWFARFPENVKMGLHRNAVLVTEGDTVDGSGAQVFCKRYAVRRLERWLGLNGRARRAHGRIQDMAALGIPTPASLGYVEGPHYGYLFQQAPLGAEDLRRLQSSGLDLAPRAEDIYQQVAGHLALLHNRGLHHGDCKWENILLETGSGRVMLIDFDGCRRLWPYNRQRFHAKDLARFILSSQENGMDQNCEQAILNAYSLHLGRPLSAGFLRRMRRMYNKIRSRHQSSSAR